MNTLSSAARLCILALCTLLVGCQDDDTSPTPASAPSGAALSASSEGAWPLFRGDPLASGVAPGTLGELSLLWKYPVDNGAFEATAVIADGVVYIGDLDGAFRALDLATGEEKWTFKSKEGAGFKAPAAIKDGFLYVGDIDGRFLCLNAANGELKWESLAEAEIDSGANFYKDNVLFGSQDATLYCLNAATGAVVWKHMIDDQIRCMPTVVEDRAFVAGCDGRLHIIDLAKGEKLADVEIDGPTGSTPAVLGDRVYFGTEGGTFFCIDWRKAEVAWKFKSKTRSQPFRASAAVTKSAVLAGGRDKLVHAFHPESGDELWTFATKGGVDSSPVVVGGHALVGSADGRFYRLDEAGKEVWKYEAGGSFFASPAVAGGKVVIANDRGVVFCFGG